MIDYNAAEDNQRIGKNEIRSWVEGYVGAALLSAKADRLNEGVDVAFDRLIGQLEHMLDCDMMTRENPDWLVEAIKEMRDTENKPQLEIAPTCIGCKKTPGQIREYDQIATAYEITAIEAVKQHEGTYNMFEKDKFYCTDCYIKAGMPVGK